MVTCIHCKTPKEEEEFGASLKRKVCKECRKIEAKEWRKRNPNSYNKTKEKFAEASREYYYTPKGKARNRGALLRKYGLTQQQYDTMVYDQGYVCMICDKPETRNRTNQLSVDHCHTTGKVRGLLCAKCNSAIGQFEDNIEVMQKAIEYLKKHQPTNLYIP